MESIKKWLSSPNVLINWIGYLCFCIFSFDNFFLHINVIVPHYILCISLDLFYIYAVYLRGFPWMSCRLCVSKMSWSVTLQSSWAMQMQNYISVKMNDVQGLWATSGYLFSDWCYITRLFQLLLMWSYI